MGPNAIYMSPKGNSPQQALWCRWAPSSQWSRTHLVSSGNQTRAPSACGGPACGVVTVAFAPALPLVPTSGVSSGQQ